MATRFRNDWLVTLDVWVALEALESRQEPVTLKTVKKELVQTGNHSHLTSKRLNHCLAEIASWQEKTRVVHEDG